MKKCFNGLLAGCVVFGFQAACGAVLCIDAGGQISIEMACGASGFPQQHSPASSPLRAAIFSDQGENSSCDQCAVDIPAPGIAAVVRITPSDPSLFLPPLRYLSALFSNDPGHDQGRDTNCSAALSMPGHALSMLRTTVLLI